MKGFFSGSFDPPTLGHKDIIERASFLCETLVVGVGAHRGKGPALFSFEERVDLLKQILSHLSNVKVIFFSELTVEAAKACDVDVLIRGVRSYADLEKELQMASANRKMAGLETLFLLADDAYVHLSGSLVREIGSYGRRLTGFVPEEIEEIIFQRVSNWCLD